MGIIKNIRRKEQAFITREQAFFKKRREMSAKKEAVQLQELRNKRIREEAKAERAEAKAYEIGRAEAARAEIKQIKAARRAKKLAPYKAFGSDVVKGFKKVTAKPKGTRRAFVKKARSFKPKSRPIAKRQITSYKRKKKKSSGTYFMGQRID